MASNVTDLRYLVDVKIGIKRMGADAVAQLPPRAQLRFSGFLSNNPVSGIAGQLIDLPGKSYSVIRSICRYFDQGSIGGDAVSFWSTVGGGTVGRCCLCCGSVSHLVRKKARMHSVLQVTSVQLPFNHSQWRVCVSGSCKSLQHGVGNGERSAGLHFEKAEA